MAVGENLEIVCTACGEVSFIRREPLYDGFRKVGTRYLCAACGHEFENEDAVPFKVARRTVLFSEEDRPRQATIFTSEEVGRNCRHCRHYVVNPFTQRCGLHGREVQATDLCEDFERAVDPDAGSDG